MTLEILQVIILACQLNVNQKLCVKEVKACLYSRQSESDSLENISLSCIDSIVLTK